MSEKPFKNITIKDITERADLNRGTFYLHYADPYELLMDMENGVLEDFQEMIDRSMEGAPGDELMPVLLPIVHYIVKTEEICRSLFENDASNQFQLKFKTLVRKNGNRLIETFFHLSDSDVSDYFFEFVTFGLYGILKKWLDNGMPQSEEEISRIANNAILSLARSFFVTKVN